MITLQKEFLKKDWVVETQAQRDRILDQLNNNEDLLINSIDDCVYMAKKLSVYDSADVEKEAEDRFISIDRNPKISEILKENEDERR